MDRNCGKGQFLGNQVLVALRKESVDRNNKICLLLRCIMVALRKESVDRNMGVGTTRDKRGVALRKESVDRNLWDLGLL